MASGPQPGWVRAAIWIFCGFFLLDTLGNMVAKSRCKRALMTPGTAVLVVCFAVVALTAS